MAGETERAIEAILMVAEDSVPPHLLAQILEVSPARVDELVDRLPRTGSITFHQLTGSVPERLEVIVMFLAVLELYKRGWVDLAQATTFGELTIVWLGVDDDDAASAAPFPVEEYQG